MGECLRGRPVTQGIETKRKRQEPGRIQKVNPQSPIGEKLESLVSGYPLLKYKSPKAKNDREFFIYMIAAGTADDPGLPSGNLKKGGTLMGDWLEPEKKTVLSGDEGRE